MKEAAGNYDSVCDIQNQEIGRLVGDQYEKACELGFDFDYVFDENEAGFYEYDPQELTEEVVEWLNANGFAD